MQDFAAMPECPMASMCKGMMDAKGARTGMIMFGLLLVALGVAVLFEPWILVALVAGLFILIGAGTLIFAGRLGRMGKDRR